MDKITEVGPRLGVRATCAALGVAPASYYRCRKSSRSPVRLRSSPRALSAQERQDVLDTLHAPRFVDLAPAEVYATLLDEGHYLCSERTMYRILAANHEVRERRDQLRHPSYAAPELMATAANELWSWDITKLKAPVKWVYYYLYVILDVFSRYVVGWMVAQRESAALAERLIEETCERQAIARGQLTLHADRGSSMRSKTVALLLADLGVTKTHSRPYTSTDNPFSEAQFKTMKYRPECPDRFGCLEHARRFCVDFFGWYNTEHRHSGLAMLTPHDIHYGLAEQRLAKRATVLGTAYATHPERFPNGVPTPGALPEAVWINKPSEGRWAQRRDIVSHPTSNNLELPTGNGTPETAAIRPRQKEMLLVAAQ
jgi:putative transposase